MKGKKNWHLVLPACPSILHNKRKEIVVPFWISSKVPVYLQRYQGKVAQVEGFSSLLPDKLTRN